MSDIFSSLKYGFIGAGSLCQSCLQGFLEQKKVPKDKIFISSRSPARLNKVAEKFGIQKVSGNEELVLKTQVIFICVKPVDLFHALEPISKVFHTKQTVISFAAGISLDTLKKLIPSISRLARVAPNTAISIGKGVCAYSIEKENPSLEVFIESLFKPLGQIFKLPEKNLSAFTVTASSGIAFVMELMQYWKEWLENHNFSPSLARTISAETFLGAATLAKHFPRLKLSHLQSQVTSKNGITEEGLKALRQAELDSILHYGFEKTALKEKNISIKY